MNMETIFMNIENSKTNKLHKFILKLAQILELKNNNMLSFKIHLFITCGKVTDNSTKIIN